MKSTKHFPVIIEIDEDGMYIVTCPSLKACRSYGATIEEAMKNMTEAIELCLDDENLDALNTFIGFRELEIAHRA